MTITNADIASAFREYADILDLNGDNVFRVRAYRNAARVVEDLAHDINKYMADGNDLKELPYIGKDLEHKILEIVRTGKFRNLENARKNVEPGVLELLHVRGLGPRKVAHLRDDLHIHSPGDLALACHRHQVRELQGFGEKTEEKILDEIEGDHPKEHRIRLSIAEQYAEPFLRYILDSGFCTRALATGSFRRRKETVGDLDFVVASDQPEAALLHATKYDDIKKVLSIGATKATVVLKSDIQVDIRAVEETSYEPAALYFTGSKEHNIALRQLAHERGWKLNEYGLFNDTGRLICTSESDIYAELGLCFIPPELRENRGEILAAKRNELPDLVSLADLKGDLHSHTRATDGRNTIREMAEAAKRAGLSYLAISDHSSRLRFVHGLGERRLIEQMQAIDELNGELDGITLLKSLEVDILPDGSLDMSDKVLAQLDLVVCAIHSDFNLSREEQTKRVLRAMDNPNFTIFAHPFCRLIGERRSIDLDFEQILEHAAKRHCFVELNSHSERLDLNDVHCRMARDAGVLISINSDAHSIYDFQNLRFGIDQARRGWLEKSDVLNTRSIKELKTLLRAKKEN